MARLRFVELTEVIVDVTMHNGNLRLITVTEWTAWYPVVSARIQEWFDAPEPSEGIYSLGGLPNRLVVSRTGKPSVAVVEFSSSLHDDQRRKAFAFNTKCLVQPSLCKAAEDILPGVRQLESSAGPD